MAKNGHKRGAKNGHKTKDDSKTKRRKKTKSGHKAVLRETSGHRVADDLAVAKGGGHKAGEALSLARGGGHKDERSGNAMRTLPVGAESAALRL